MILVYLLKGLHLLKSHLKSSKTEIWLGVNLGN